MFIITPIHFNPSPPGAIIQPSGLRPAHIELPIMNRIDEAYRITYVTLDELQLQFETQIAVTEADGSLALHRAATLPDERRALRELIRREPLGSAA